MSSFLKKLVDEKLESTVGPVVHSFFKRHQMGENTVKRALGFYVCRKCNHAQAKQFACCPKCHTPIIGLYVKKP